MRWHVRITMEVCIVSWEEAKQEIKEHVVVDTNINTKRCKKSKYYRYVRAVTARHVRVQIGRNNYITIPWTMLEECWHELNRTGRYDGKVFGKYYPKEKENKPCYVHSVGKIFEKAGLVDSVDDKFYVLK